jgi:hypothetical protein
VLKNPIMMSAMMPMMRRLMNDKMKAGGDKEVELSMNEYKQIEYDAWHKPGKNWNDYVVWRPYNVNEHVNIAPAAGTKVPDGSIFVLKDGDGVTSTLMEEARKLAQEKGTEYCGLLFYSITCPIGRTYACHDLYKAVAALGIPVIVVYTLEAHPHGTSFHTGD